MTYVTSDLHGCRPDVLMELLNRAGFTDADNLYILGDVIDRGRHGVALLRLILGTPNATLLLGNHEDMLLGCDFVLDPNKELSPECLTYNQSKKLQNWIFNGAEYTIDALQRLSADTRTQLHAMLKKAPLYKELNVDGRRFILTHGGLGDFEPHRSLANYTRSQLLWTRPSLETEYSHDFITVLGHTPTCFYGTRYRGKIIRTESWINIDTGAACGLYPSLLRLDDMKEFYYKS